MSNKVYKYSDIDDKILSAVSLIADPVTQTLSPKGGNVMFMHNDKPIISNDGITIAKNINPEDKLDNAIVSMIRESSIRTNNEAGDGTTTSILLASTLIKEGIELRKLGVNPQDVAKFIRTIPNRIIPQIDEQKKTDVSDEIKFSIAKISASGDDTIANNTVKTINVVGNDGMVFIDNNNKIEDEVVIDVGYIVNVGMYSPVFRNNGFTHISDNTPVLLTDKNLYYAEEVTTILKALKSIGSKSIAIFAKDFSGKAIEWFKANHGKDLFNILLVKVSDQETLFDMSVYLNTPIVKDSDGSIVDNLPVTKFGSADKILSYADKTIINKDTSSNEELKTLCSDIKKKIDEGTDDESLKKRLASLTNGMVTIKVGGATDIEIKERIFRYEDSVNATRALIKEGYLPGAGVSLWQAWHKDNECIYEDMVEAFCKAPAYKIGENCGKTKEEVDEMMSTSDLNNGYDAVTDSIVDVLENNIIDPYSVTKLAIENSCSVAANILSVNYYILDNKEEENANSK